MVRVISCEYIGEEQTYDLEIGHKDHQFYTSSGFLTSNSHSTCYAFNSYQCAWLYTYYEKEWIKACLECDPNLEETIATVRKLGYNVLKPDVNWSEPEEWNIFEDKTAVPAFTSLKGMGGTASNEIIAKRPKDGFKDLEDFFFDGEDWRWKKLNKRSLEALVKMEGFESLKCVGPNKVFKNYAHMFNTLFGETTKFKKNKYITYKNFDLIKSRRSTVEELALETDDTDWPVKEKMAQQKEIMGFFDKNLIVGKYLKVFNEFEIEAVDEKEDEKNKSKVWFVVDDVKEKKTKTGKPFLVVTASGMTEKSYNFKVWNESLNGSKFQAGAILVTSLEYDKNWGYNVARGAKIMEVNK